MASLGEIKVKITVELNLAQLQLLIVLVRNFRAPNIVPEIIERETSRLVLADQLITHLENKRTKLFNVKASDCVSCNKENGATTRKTTKLRVVSATEDGA